MPAKARQGRGRPWPSRQAQLFLVLLQWDMRLLCGLSQRPRAARHPSPEEPWPGPRCPWLVLRAFFRQCVLAHSRNLQACPVSFPGETDSVYWTCVASFLRTAMYAPSFHRESNLGT